MKQYLPIAAAGKIDREPILLLIDFVLWQPHRVFGSAP